jgi:very-short-patch-repair endonuclease
MPEVSTETIRVQVEGLRHKLLDLSMRNRMLNYRASKRLGVTILGEEAQEVYKILVADGKKMSFVGKPGPPLARPKPGAQFALTVETADTDASVIASPISAVEDAEPGEGEVVLRSDTRLTTDEFETALNAKLRLIQREAQLAKDELGINTLFLTLGTLEWNETEARSFRAPLLYVPVSLERQMNGAARLVYDGSDVGDNLPLRAKMAEFGLTLPEYNDEAAVEDYVGGIDSVIATRPGWAVHRDEICLGFFNYEKYAMYRDLGGEAWPDDRKPWLHPDIVAMLGTGYANPDEQVTEKTFLDDVRPLAASHEVYDADSSQTLAMIRAAGGLSIVVEGPPGTGKSQTITNIIAEAGANGKTVLFVAAKRAAVDVVKRRLTDAGLGGMCLDLHDKLTNRREFYAEIKSTLSRSLKLKDEEERVARLDELRTRLTGHSRAANEPLTEFGGSLTPFAAMASLARLPNETQADRDGRIAFEKLKTLTPTQVSAGLPTVRSLQVRLGATGVPVRHAFWGAAIPYLDPAIRLDLDAGLQSAIEACARASHSFQHVSERLHIVVPPTAENVRVLRLCAERALNAPPLDGVALRVATWQSSATLIREVIANLMSRREILHRRQGAVQDGIETADKTQTLMWAGSLRSDGVSLWNADITQALRAYEENVSRWYRLLNSDFRAARRMLRSFLSPGTPTDPQTELEILRDVRAVQKAAAFIAAQEAQMRLLFGVQWQELATDPAVLERLLAWILSLSADVQSGLIPAGLMEFLAGEHTDDSLLREVEQAERDSETAVQTYAVAADLLAFPAEAVRKEAWSTLAERLCAWQAAMPELPNFIAYSEARRQAIAQNLEAIVEIADHWELASERLEEAFLRSYYTGIVREAMRQRLPLRNFDRVAHEQSIAEFQTLDDFKLKYNRACVRLAHHRNLPSFDLAAGNLQVLKVQCELQRRHKPIRWIMGRAGEAIQRTKPVFMMSPLTVAVHLPPELPPFDMVIFDEASQIKPEDALCSIIRGRQIIVVGDTKQMPPSNFFDRLDGGDGYEEEDAEEVGLGQEARKLESVLSLMSAAVSGRVRRPDLRWHYRSLHPSLIQPSNELFYDNRLIIFPCAYTDLGGHRVGIVFHHAPETVYESGEGKRINRREAEIVAQAVYQHVKERRTESLMIAAMNKPQADLIFDEVSKRERDDPIAFQRFREAHPFEPLDVKNLENVQGDERDVVFISVTYGRDASGAILQRFGPLLKEGGERRLNVLISRARKRCEVFSNITADDLRVDKPVRGLVALKSYLNYAQKGRLDVSLPTGGAEESPFEEEVSALLRQRGYDVHTQVGCEGYRIDLAVLDSAQPGRYLLGIECDGATYHSANSARDRDKLRQRVLENRGWRLHRIWSPDWWQDRDGEVQRLVAEIEAARTEETPEQEFPLEPPVEAAVEVEVDETVGQSNPNAITRPYTLAALPKNVATANGLKAYLCDVVRHEGPITHELLFTRLRTASGYARSGRNVRATLDDMIAAAVRERRFKAVGDAYVVDAADYTRPRDWSDRPDAERKHDLVTHLEIASALRCVIKSAFGIRPEEAVREAFRLLGFRRLSEQALADGHAILDTMTQAGELIQQDGLVRPM